MKRRCTGGIAALIALLMALCGAQAAQDDPFAVLAGDIGYRQSEAQAYFDGTLEAYRKQGRAFTREDLAALRDAVMDSLISQAVLEHQYRALGLDGMTAEDEGALRENARAAYERTVSESAESLAQAYGTTADEALETARSLLRLQGLTEDTFYSQALAEYKDERLLNFVVGDVSATDSEISDAYETYYVAPCREAYANDIERYETEVLLGGQASYFTPSGYRRVTHILLPIPDELMPELYALYDAYARADEAFGDALASLKQLQIEDADTTTAQTEYEAAIAARAQAKTAYTGCLVKALDAHSEEIAQIESRLRAGEDFAALVAAYSSDDAMPKDGYVVRADSAIWAEAFRDAAMALQTIGEISPPVASEGGVHIIRYETDVPSGAAALTDELRAQIEAALIRQKRYAALEDALKVWRAELSPFADVSAIVLPDPD